MPKHNAQCQMKFTTPDCKFQKELASLYSETSLYSCASESDKIQSIITENQGILDILNGVSLPFSTPWYLVDYVLVPIWLDETRHWVLAVIDFKNRLIIVHNTSSGKGLALIMRKALLPLSTILPHYLLLTDFYSRTDIDFSANCYAQKSRTLCFRSLMKKTSACRASL